MMSAKNERKNIYSAKLTTDITFGYSREIYYTWQNEAWERADSKKKDEKFIESNSVKVEK